MRLLLQHDREVAHWVAMRIPVVARRLAEPSIAFGEAFGPSTAIGVLSEPDAEGRAHLLGGVVFHAYDPWCRSIELSFASASARWLTRSLIREILAYPFDQLGCARITGVTPKRAADARRFLDKFGFKREGVIRRGFGDDDAIVSGLLRREWEASRYRRPRVEAPHPAEAPGCGATLPMSVDGLRGTRSEQEVGAEGA